MTESNIYAVYEEVARGTARELGEKYFVDPVTIRACAKGDKTFLGHYYVVKAESADRPYTYLLLEDGKAVDTGTAKELAEHLGTVQQEIHTAARRGHTMFGKYKVRRIMKNAG